MAWGLQKITMPFSWKETMRLPRKLTFEVQSLIGILKAYEKLYTLQ